MNKSSYLIVVPDGVGIRNFFCTRVIDRLLESGQVCVWHALPHESIEPFQQRWEGRVRWEVLPPIHDGLVERFFRQSKIYAQLYWQRKLGPDVQLQRRRPPSHWKPWLIDRAERIVGNLCSGPRRILWLDRMHQALAARAPHTRAFLDFLEKEKPSSIFCTHQRALQAVPAMVAAKKLGIPSAVFIYSWDNLPKGRMAVYAERYFVWSEHMRKELQTYYPDVKDDQIRVVGTPQFENYFNAALMIPRAKFFGDLGLDMRRPVVCFSGNDINSPFDPTFLEDLAEGLRLVPAGRRPQILFRRSPVDTTPRYDEILKKYSEIVVSNPLWKRVSTGDWSQLVPTQEDGALLVNVVAHCDIVVNVGSTMGMDFAIFDKPAIYAAYNPKGKEHLWDIHEVYRLPHFASVHELQPVYWAKTPAELSTLVIHALMNKNEKQSARKAWLDLIVRGPLESASERFAAEIAKMALNGQDTHGPRP